MADILVANIIGILCLTALAFFFGPDDKGNSSRRFAAAWVFGASVWLSFWCWVAFVAVHFITKFW